MSQWIEPSNERFRSESENDVCKYDNNLLTTNNNKMKFRWFKRSGIFFIPISIIGLIIALTGLACAVYLFLDIDSRSHSASDTLIKFVFNLIIIGAVYSLIGYLTSRRNK
jgi:hypothetical protein